MRTRTQPAARSVRPVPDALDEYRRKRDFGRTPEPSGEEAWDTDGSLFVVQKHDAQRLHFDLRLERDGVLKSWAVPKGPSLDPGEKRLAVQVEDHPLAYADFEGVIPDEEYGGGTVMLWDRGRWRPTDEGDDRLDFELAGEKLTGAWTLVRMRGRASEGGKNWLLIKRSDDAADPDAGDPDAGEGATSIATGRTMQEIARDRDRTWSSASGEVDPPERPPDPTRLAGARKKKLPAEPRPQLATLVREAPDGDDWLHEIKFDGYRILARVESGRARLLSRNGKDWTERFPEIARLLETLPAEAALLDGEVVALESGGNSSFRRLQEALSAGRTQALVYQAFDLLHLDGLDLTGVGQLERKQTLQPLLSAAGLVGSSRVRYTDHLEGRGGAFHAQVCRLGLEGMISKRTDARYRSERTRAWLKVKCTRHQELLVGGYTDPGGARSAFGALLLGARDEAGRLAYAGKVGTGFSERQLGELHGRLQALEVEASPFDPAPPERGVHWVEPVLVVEVEFTEWTGDGMLRHPVYRGLREDRDPDEITLPPPAGRAAAASVGRNGGDRTQRRRTAGGGPGGRRSRGAAAGEAEVAGVRLTHPERVLYPEQGVTKLALAEYFASIESWILPELADRPLSLVRCPQGREKTCFYQKHPGEAMHERIPRIEIAEKDGTAPYLYVRELPHLISLVQAGVLELHVWGSRVDDVERPDRMVFDLDPGPGVAWTEVLRVARELRERLAELGLESLPRTTGGKGLHVVVPLERRQGWDEVKAFAQAVAQAHAHDDRKRVTTNMAKAKRQGRIFLDYLRNGRGATAIASYSTRAREGATVAVPVRWDELDAALRPDRYHIGNLTRRLAALPGDPWEGFAERRRALTRAMRAAVGLTEGRAP